MWLLINDIPVCSYRVTSGVILGNYIYIYKYTCIYKFHVALHASIAALQILTFKHFSP
jgi:hypothetical protein